MNTFKKAMLISICIHLVGILGGEVLLRWRRPDRKQVIYPIRLIEIAESSPKVPARPQKIEIKEPEKEIKKTPKIVKKRVEKKAEPKEPKTGIPIKKKAKVKKAPKKEKVEPKKVVTKEEIKKVKQAIEQIRIKKLNEEKQAKQEQAPIISKDFIDRLKQDYASLVDRQIKENWSIPKTFLKDMGELEAIVVLKIKPNGELAEAKLEKRSGFHPFDESTIRAIKKAAPFPPPPVDIKDEEFEIRFYSN